MTQMIRMIFSQSSSPTHNLISTSERIFASSTPKIPIVTDPSPVAPRPRRSHPKPSWFTHWFSQNHLSCHLSPRQRRSYDGGTGRLPNMRPGCFAEDIISNRTIQVMPCSAPVYATTRCLTITKPIPASGTGCQRLEFACSQNWALLTPPVSRVLQVCATA